MTSKKKSYFKILILFWIIFLFAGSSTILFIYAIAKGKFGQLPSFEELENPSNYVASEVISSDGKVIGKYYIENRSNVKFEEISPNIINALIAAEDIRYYEHSGIDLKGLFRVFFKTVLLGQKGSGGGSTITQQLAKNLFPRKSFEGFFEIIITKIKEWITAIKLEKNYTKQEVLTMYFNTVSFGGNSYGIKSAAGTFFDKPPQKLNIQESAMLVGVLKGTTFFSPQKNPDRALARRNIVLSQMNKYDFISDSLYDTLKNTLIELSYKIEDHNEGLAPYYREILREKLHEWCKTHQKADGTPYDLYRDGLKIYSTIDSRMQEYAEIAVKQHLTELQQTFFNHWKGREPWRQHKEVIDLAMKRSDRYINLKAKGISRDSIRKIFTTPIKMKIFAWKGEMDTLMSPLDSIKYHKYFLLTGMMSMEPHTGYIRAWVGGINHKYFQYDHVYRGSRQVGSTFKPFLYTVAIDNKISPCMKVPNIPVTILDELNRKWTPENADTNWDGKMMTLKFALANSVNRISAYLMKQFGPEAVVNVARKMGITSPIDAVPAICLGTPDLTVYELTGAYSTFANKGVWTEPIFVTRIEDKNGNLIEEFVPKRVDALSEETAYGMVEMLKYVVERGTGGRVRYRYKLTNPIAGKTGTTQNHSDGWFMGVTPELVTGVWVGCEDRSAHFRSIDLGQGATLALPIFGLYMQQVYADSTLNIYDGDFEKPARLTIEFDCKKYEQQNQSGEDFGEEFD